MAFYKPGKLRLGTNLVRTGCESKDTTYFECRKQKSQAETELEVGLLMVSIYNAGRYSAGYGGRHVNSDLTQL